MKDTAGFPFPRSQINGELIYPSLAILLGVVPIIHLLMGSGGTILLATLLGVAFVLLIASEYREHGHPLTSAGICLMGSILLFSIRPISIYKSGTTTAGGMLDEYSYSGIARTAGTEALTEISIFYSAFSLVYFLGSRNHLQSQAAPDPDSIFTGRTVDRLRILVVLSLIIGFSGVLMLIVSSGGVSAYLTGLSIRSSFLSGKFYFTLSYVPLSCSLVLYVLARRRAHLPQWDLLSVTSFTSLLVIAFLSGGRGPLILGALLPVLILKQTGSRPFRLRTLTALGAVVISGAMVMSITLRENVYSDGQTLVDFKSDPLGFLLDRLSSGAETRPFDSLILLNIQSLTHNLPVLWGETYARMPTWFIPSALLSSKDSGANTWFTRTYIPRFYYPDHIETSISAIGEGFANFRWIGIVLAGILFGLFCRWLRDCASSTVPRKEAITVLVSPIAFSIVRGDSYQSVSLTILTIVVVAIQSAISGSRIVVGRDHQPQVSVFENGGEGGPERLPRRKAQQENSPHRAVRGVPR